MSKETDIWMPIVIGDYLKDTQHLDATRHGCYLLWLMHYWIKGPLPNSIDELILIGKLRSSDAPSIAQSLLAQFFTLGSDGLYHQKRADFEKIAWSTKQMKAKKKAAAAANARWKNRTPRIAPRNASSITQAVREDMHKECPSPSPNENTSYSHTGNETSPPPPEELIYREHPRQESYPDAIREISKAVERIRRGEGPLPPIPDQREARVWLYRRTQEYARSPAGRRPDREMIPAAPTWYAKSRYLDDESNWQFSGSNGHGPPPKQQLRLHQAGDEIE